jgi:hypothetical protein
MWFSRRRLSAIISPHRKEYQGRDIGLHCPATNASGTVDRSVTILTPLAHFL